MDKNTVSTIAVSTLSAAAAALSFVKDLKDVLGVSIHPMYLYVTSAVLIAVAIYLNRTKLRATCATVEPIRLSLTLSVVVLLLSITLGGLMVWLSEQHLQMESLTSTEYVGTFPHNLPSIIKLIKDTSRELTIATDFPAYGGYSDPSGFDAYRDAIAERLGKGVGVTLFVYATSLASKATTKQFDADDWQQMSVSQVFTNFTRYHSGEPVPNSKEELYRRFAALDDEFLHHIQSRGAKIRRLANELPAYCWISDARSAIFSFYNLEGEASEVSFFTRNGSLLRVLDTLNKKASGSPEFRAASLAQ
jgi:hypothetical protein